MNSADEFETIVCEHYAPLFRFALSLTRADADARDLIQQTFYTWATKGHQLRDIQKVRAWLYTTLHRAFLDSRRRQVRFPHHDLERVSGELPVVDPVTAEAVDSAQVLSALSRVDDPYQSAVALFYLEDCSYKDIAMILDVPVGTVKSRIARGITQLREFLLSDGSRVSFLPKYGISRIWKTDKPATPLKPFSLPARHHGRLQPSGFAGRGSSQSSVIETEECLINS